MTSPTDSELRAMAAEFTYPANQNYDPVTLSPSGVTRQRVELMEQNMPQLLAGGGSLLDLGSNKGFIPMLLRDRYDLIVGYERSGACHVAEQVRQHHRADNIQFINKSFRQVKIGKGHTIGTPDHSESGWLPRRYEVVYVGSVHHHFVKDAILHEAPWWLPLKKLAALADKYLILDGPFTFENDCSLGTWEKEYGWPDSVRAGYTFAAHTEALSPQFKLVCGPTPNERGRHSAVFERVQPDVPRMPLSADAVAGIQAKGQTIQANKARKADSVVRVRDLRYKFDRGMQTDGVLLVCNSLPEWFAKTVAVLLQDGNRIGDLAEWAEGAPLTDPVKIAPHWLRLNHILASVGLVEIHFKVGDYVQTPTSVVDVDLDMMADVENISMADAYLTKWVRAGPKDAFGEDLAKWIADNLADEFVFQKAMKKWEAMR